jgi:hypothetical protein
MTRSENTVVCTDRAVVENYLTSLLAMDWSDAVRLLPLGVRRVW